MYKKISLIALFIISFFAKQIVAQSNGDRVESIKVAYLSEKLNLDPKTAERFWPIYNQYDDEMRKVIQESKRANDTRSVEEILDQEQKAVDVKRKYSGLFQKVINGEQLSNLYQAEKEFHKILLRRMNRMENRQQQRQDAPRMERPRQRMERNDMNQAPAPSQRPMRESRPEAPAPARRPSR